MKKSFKKPVILLLCAVIALSACLSGCGGKLPNFPVALSAADRSALELCTTAYKDSDLDTIYQFMQDGSTVKQLNDKYAIECLRQRGDACLVIYEGNTRVLVLSFDAQGNWIETSRLASIYRMTDTRGKFDKLQVGDNVTKVQTIDPTCFFPFLVSEIGEPYETHHYTEDGYYTHITYDKDLNIESISWELM